ncbi:hypothetical protein SAMN05428975_3539 [Mucilaginibacter sp. OK268]|nr:hypothetical protein SAMN05428975_3539 [Mucilaginibacter sp. OK268]
MCIFDIQYCIFKNCLFNNKKWIDYPFLKQFLSAYHNKLSNSNRILSYYAQLLVF